MQNNYKDIIYNNYHRYHTKNLYGDVSIDFIKNQFIAWKYYFSEFLPKDKTQSILDAGCGTGGFVFWLIEQGYINSEGIDLSEEMIEIGLTLQIRNIKQADIFEHLRNTKNYYDVIFCRDVLEHFKKQEIFEIFSLFYESLTPHGKIIIQVPNGYSPSYSKIFYSDFTHETLFSESVLNQLTIATGFKSINVKEIRPVPHGFFSMTRFILWKLLKIKYQFYQLIENGHSRGYFSQNIVVEIRK